MPVRRKYVWEAVLVVCGIALGLAVAGFVGRAFLIRAGQAELESYAQRLLGVGIAMAGETDQAVNTIRGDGLPMCSDIELAEMRQFVFNAAHVRVLGRVRAGKLVCSTGLGRLAAPAPLPKPDFDVRGIDFSLRAPTLLSPGSKGFVVVNGDIAVMLNPESYVGLDELPMYYSGLLYDPIRKQAMYSIGHVMPLSNAEVVAQKPVERDGVFYQPVCATQAVVCDVAAETRDDMLARDWGHYVSFLVGGALLGGMAALTLVLFYERQRSLERRLRRAVRNGEITLVYQPVVDLDTDKIVGAEALARWTSESNETVPPDVFIAVAEEKGFVNEITALVVRRAVEEMGELLRHNGFRVTVNIAAQDLADPAFLERLEQCLAARRVNAANVGLELTERSTADKKMAGEVIARLRASGHTVYIDDFGTGYSSLSYLHRLDADAIKIDRAFTRTVGTDAVTASVVPQILDIARELDLKVVVEGIETGEQAEYFRQAQGGLMGQGWLYGKPVPAAQLKKMLDGKPH